MTKEHWFCSDHHLGQESSLTWLDNQGREIRPFSSLDEMHQVLIDNHNKLVKSSDKVTMVGDIVMTKEAFTLLPQFNGSLRIVKGNHDIFKDSLYSQYFEKIDGVKVIADRKVFITHIPIHKSVLDAKEGWINIHGHTHTSYVLDDQGNHDPRYLNVCLDANNFSPVNLDDLLARRP